MDFGRQLEAVETTVSRSKIRHIDPVDPNSSETADQDHQVMQMANKVASEAFWGQNPSDGHLSIDAAQFKAFLTPSRTTIQEGDLVVIQQSFGNLDFVYAKKGGEYANRNGLFYHDDFIGLPFGSKLRSRSHSGFGYCYVLKPTPELWTRCLNQRTQVIHELDQSQILSQLYLRPNCIVVESGTGSGAMSHAILRTIAPHGTLYTYEFNRSRADSARTEFTQHRLGHLVEVIHKDVCRGLCENSTEQTGLPGFDRPPQSVDAVFLDLPEPWLAVPHAAYILRPNARIGSYSPCVEQTQRVCQALEQCGFHSIKTFEYRLQEHYVDEVRYDPPPTAKRKRPEVQNMFNYKTKEDFLEKEHDGSKEKQELSKAKESLPSSSTEQRNDNVTAQDEKTSPQAEHRNSKSMLVARPFTTMRGHTAFLTFATSGLVSQPDPNGKASTA